MKTHSLSKILTLLGTAALLTLGAVPAQAGPSPFDLYVPVTTMAAARELPAGRQIAITCGKCGAVSLTRVDKDRTYLQGFTCPGCHKEFKAHTASGKFVYMDDSGHIARLSAIKGH